jgi:simple sugar transport system ATP-binding protein
LSGGNVQRAVLRELSREEISHRGQSLLRPRLCRGGGSAPGSCWAQPRCGVLLVSEDLDEILQLSDRIVVMFDGKLALQTDAANADVGAIGRAMAGH